MTITAREPTFRIVVHAVKKPRVLCAAVHNTRASLILGERPYDISINSLEIHGETPS